LDILTLSWAALVLITLGLAFSILCIQGFDMYGAVVQRCGEQGGACEEFLMDPDADIFGVLPSVLALGLLFTILFLFIMDFNVGLIELILATISGVASLYYIALQVSVRRYCSICNFFHLSNLALTSASLFLVWRLPPPVSVPDLLLAGLIFATVTTSVTFTVRFNEKREDAEHAKKVFKSLLELEDHRKLAVFQAGQPFDFPVNTLINLSPDTPRDVPTAVLTISIGCHFCADALEWMIENLENLSEYWKLKLVFVDSKESNLGIKPLVAVIYRSCEAMPLPTRHDCLRLDVLPFLQGRHNSLGRLNRIPGNPTKLMAVEVPVVPFSPALVVNEILIDEAVNFPEKILSIPLVDRAQKYDA
jgi:uncharacterized membrane protein